MTGVVGVFTFIGVGRGHRHVVAGMGGVSDRMDEPGDGEEQVEQEQDDKQ